MAKKKIHTSKNIGIFFGFIIGFIFDIYLQVKNPTPINLCNPFTGQCGQWLSHGGNTIFAGFIFALIFGIIGNYIDKTKLGKIIDKSIKSNG